MKTAKYFSATWCGPCKVFKPIMKELSDEGYDIQFIDGDENPKLANKYNIRSVPTDTNDLLVLIKACPSILLGQGTSTSEVSPLRKFCNTCRIGLILSYSK